MGLHTLLGLGLVSQLNATENVSGVVVDKDPAAVVVTVVAATVAGVVAADIAVEVLQGKIFGQLLGCGVFAQFGRGGG